MKNNFQNSISQNTELIERLTSVTEQLEDIVTITKGKGINEPHISLEKMTSQMKKKMGGNAPMILFAIFRLFALKNLLRGRLHLTAYTIGKQLGFAMGINSLSEFKKEISKLGIGNIIIEKLDNEGVQIKMDSTITSMGIKNSPSPICYFECGLLSGAVEKLLRKRTGLTEETCCGMGDRACLFKVNFKERPSSKQILVSEGIDTDLYSKENIKLLTTLASHSITAIENTLRFEEAKRQSIIDGLTGVYNHAYFQRMLKIEVMRTARHRAPLSLLVLDVDKFKHYNDDYGHQQGDRVLKVIATFLSSNVREVDVIARYGGDEFVVILPQTDKKNALLVANRIKTRIKALLFKHDRKEKSTHFTLSMGLATIGEDKMLKPELFFEEADKKLLLAKRKGGNRIIS